MEYKMTYNELLAIFKNCSKDDWIYNSLYDNYIYKEDINLHIELDQKKGDPERFYAEWVQQYEGPSYMVKYLVFYNSTCLFGLVMVAIDGYNAELPIPEFINGSGVISEEQYKFAQIIDIRDSLDDYLVKAEIKVK